MNRELTPTFPMRDFLRKCKKRALCIFRIDVKLFGLWREEFNVVPELPRTDLPVIGSPVLVEQSTHDLGRLVGQMVRLGDAFEQVRQIMDQYEVKEPLLPCLQTILTLRRDFSCVGPSSMFTSQ